MTTEQSILLIAFHFPPESVPGAARPFRFYRYLPEFGVRVHVVTAAKQSEPNPDIVEIPAPTLYPNKYTLAGFTEILLHKIAFPTELGLLWAADAAAAGAKLMRANSVQAIVSTAPPLNTHLAALRLKQKTGCPWIADFRDPLAGNPFRLHGRMPEMADRWVEELIFRHADCIIGVTDAMTEDWKARYPQWRHKIQLLWNGFDPGEELNATPAAAADQGCKVLAHVGSLYGRRHPMAVLRALEQLIRSRRTDTRSLRVKLVGGMDNDVRDISPETIRFLQASGCLEILPFMDRAKALEHMVAAEALMLIDLYGDRKAYAVPSKLYEYIRLGRPILALTQPGSPVSHILERSGVPFLCVYPDQTIEETAETLLRLVGMPSETSVPSQWFLENFDGRNQAGTLAQTITSLVATAQSGE